MFVLKGKSKMNLISVVVPVYKVEKYLNKCLESIVNQTYRDIEIILVDDGSPDNSGTFCDMLASMDNRVKVIHKGNGGLSDARNAGIGVATGEYIIFVDSDDYINLEMIQRLHSACIENNADISICGVQMVNEDEVILGELPVIAGTFSGMQIIEEYDYRHGAYIVTWNKIYKRHLFTNIRYETGKIHEDEFIFHKIFSKSSRVVCINDALYYYLQRKGSIMSQKSQDGLMNYIEALLYRIKWMQDNQFSCECIYRTFHQLSKTFCYVKSIGNDKKASEQFRKQYFSIIKYQINKENILHHKLFYVLEMLNPGYGHTFLAIKRRI